MEMGLLDKVWLRWDEPWWSQNAQQWTRVAAADDSFVPRRRLVSQGRSQPERARQLDGRLLPIHMEKVGQRADTLVD